MAYPLAGGAQQNGSPAPGSAASSDVELVAALSSPTTQPALKATGTYTTRVALRTLAALELTPVCDPAAAQAVDPLSRLLLGPAEASAKKVALAGFASAYPYLFRYACAVSSPE